VLSPASICGISHLFLLKLSSSTPPQAGFHIYFYKDYGVQQAQADPPSPFCKRRAMAGQAQKDSPPHILAHY
jgi:hypothetical protein